MNSYLRNTRTAMAGWWRMESVVERRRSPMVIARRCTIAMMAFAVVAGCTTTNPDLTAAEAGETLKTHINELMAKADLPAFQVIDPGGRDFPCENNGKKRTYAVRSPFRGDAEGLIAELTGTLASVWGYEVDKVFVPDTGKTVLKLTRSRTTVTLDLPAEHVVMVSGETDCVPTGV
jgi:hypothetical protein